MKIEIKERNIELYNNGAEDIILRGVNIGNVPKNVIDNYYIYYFENKGKPLSNLERYLCGYIHKTYNIPYITKEDVILGENIIKTKTNKSTIELIKYIMENNIIW